jgi:hypothetical protein
MQPQISQMTQIAIFKILSFPPRRHADIGSPVCDRTRILYQKRPNPKPPQGACPAQEVGGVGGETSGTARVRAACSERSRTGLAPDKAHPPAQRSIFLKRGCGGSRPCVCDFSSRSQTSEQFTRPIGLAKTTTSFTFSLTTQPPHEISSWPPSPLRAIVVNFPP